MRGTGGIIDAIDHAQTLLTHMRIDTVPRRKSLQCLFQNHALRFGQPVWHHLKTFLILVVGSREIKSMVKGARVSAELPLSRAQLSSTGNLRSPGQCPGFQVTVLTYAHSGHSCDLLTVSILALISSTTPLMTQLLMVVAALIDHMKSGHKDLRLQLHPMAVRRPEKQALQH